MTPRRLVRVAEHESSTEPRAILRFSRFQQRSLTQVALRTNGPSSDLRLAAASTSVPAPDGIDVVRHRRAPAPVPPGQSFAVGSRRKQSFALSNPTNVSGT